MVKNVMVLTVAVLFLCCSILVFAEEGEGGLDFGLSIGVGAATFDGETYSVFNISPDIAFGKFGLGFELIVNYQAEQGIREEDWIPSGSDNILDVYLPKFKYIRYGFKGEPLYAKLGSIDDALLGNGFIMNRYDNTLFVPEKRIFGLSFDLDGALFNFPYVGIETVVGNLSRLDVIGVRPFIRPLAFTEIPIISDLQIGGTVAVDRDPGLYDDDATGSEDLVIAYGGDARLPLLSKPAISLALFGDIAALQIQGDADRGIGGMVGIGGRLIGFLNYGAQLRILGDDFIPSYFDYAYDLFRLEKYNLLDKNMIGKYNGWLAHLGFAFLDDAIQFNATLDGDFVAGGDPNNYLDWPHLYAEFILAEGIVPNVSLIASFDKRGIGADMEHEDKSFFEDVFGAEDSIFAARINYAIGAAVLSFVYQLSYDPATNGWEKKSGIESAIKVF
jgi:hypothetical protein